CPRRPPQFGKNGPKGNGNQRGSLFHIGFMRLLGECRIDGRATEETERFQPVTDVTAGGGLCYARVDRPDCRHLVCARASQRHVTSGEGDGTSGAGWTRAYIVGVPPGKAS